MQDDASPGEILSAYRVGAYEPIGRLDFSDGRRRWWRRATRTFGSGDGLEAACMYPEERRHAATPLLGASRGDDQGEQGQGALSPLACIDREVEIIDDGRRADGDGCLQLGRCLAGCIVFYHY